MTDLKNTHKLIADHCDLDRLGGPVTLDTTWDELGVDSLGVYQIALDAEELHGINLVDDDIAYTKNVGDLEALIERKLMENRRG